MKRLIPTNVTAPAGPAGRLPFAFGRRLFLLLLIGLLWILPAWGAPRFLYVMAFWDLLALALWAWDLHRLPKPARLAVSRIWTRPLGLSQQSTVGIELANSSRVALLARVVDEAPSAFCSSLPELRITVPPNASAAASYTLQPSARGDAAFGDAWLRYQTPLGFAERWARACLAQTVRVYPNLAEAQRMSIYLMRSRQIELEKRLKRLRGHGREFESLREFRAGDEFRDISWNVTARRGKLITKVYQIERSQTVWLVLDAGRLMRARVGDLTRLDYAINAALSLAQVAFHSGDRVALLAYGRKPQQRLAPGRGPAQQRALLECLSQVKAEPLEADHLLAAEILLSRQSRRSLIVWLTDLAETAATPEVVECASTMARRHLVLLGVMAQTELHSLVAARPENPTQMYRYTAALEILQRRDLLLRQLRQQGALTLETTPAGLSTGLVNQYLEVKERSLL